MVSAPPDTPLSTQPAPLSPDDPISTLRERCEALISSDTMDKEIALGILRLQHAAESALLGLKHSKDSAVSEVRHEIELLRAKRGHESMVQEVATNQTIAARAIASHESRLDGIEHRLDALETAVQTLREPKRGRH